MALDPRVREGLSEVRAALLGGIGCHKKPSIRPPDFTVLTVNGGDSNYSTTGPA